MGTEEEWKENGSENDLKPRELVTFRTIQTRQDCWGPDLPQKSEQAKWSNLLLLFYVSLHVAAGFKAF